jgi:hypothetical protein
MDRGHCISSEGRKQAPFAGMRQAEKHPKTPENTGEMADFVS